MVKINDVEYGTGTGKNKKEAKAVAAKKTWEMIEKQVSNFFYYFLFLLVKVEDESLKVANIVSLFSLF